MKHILKYILLTAVIACILTGCKVGKDYQRPETGLPEDYYLGSSGDSVRRITDTITYNSIKWQEFFQDSVLVGLIDTALKNNIEIQKAVKNIEIASQEFKQRGANFLPTLEAMPQFQREYHSRDWYANPSAKYYGDRTPPTSFFTNEIHHSFSLMSNWELDIWGKFRRMKEAAKAEFLRTSEFKKAVQTTIVSEIAINYYNLLMLDAQLKVAKTNVELNNNTLNIVKLQYKSGQVTALAIQQTEAQMLVAASLIPQIEKEYVVCENAINMLMGRYPQKIDISKRFEDAEPHTLYSIGVPLELLKNRPDVAAAEYGLVAANARVGVAQAMRYPTLNIGAVLGVDAMKLENIFNASGAGFAEFGGSLLQPLLQNRRLKTNFKVAQAERDIAILDFKQSLLLGVNEVSNAMVNIDKLENEYKIAQTRIEVSQKGVKNASLLFKSGMANYLEVITAQSTALQNDLNLVRVKMQLLYADIELYRSLGGGWQ